MHLEYTSRTINQNRSPLLFSLTKWHIQALWDEIVSQEDFPLFNTTSLIHRKPIILTELFFIHHFLNFIKQFWYIFNLT